MKQKRKRDEKREPQTPQWSQPTGVIGTKPPPEQRSYKGWGWGKLYVRSTSPPEPEITDHKTLLEPLLFIALFVLFLIAITILELALRG